MITNKVSKSIVCIGQVAYDITLPLPEKLIENQKYRIFNKMECLGGPATNASYLCAKWHASTTLIGRVGNDAYGHSIIEALNEIGVNTNYMKILDDFHTPLSIILNHQESGARTILNNPGEVKANAFTLPMDCDVILVDAHELEVSLEVIQRYPHAITILDAGTCRKNTIALAKEVDYLICSEAFARAYYQNDWDYTNPVENKAVMQSLQALNKNHVVITLGEYGLLYEENNEIVHVPAFLMDAIDTTGAGDIFHGAFAYAVSQQMNMREALILSSMASAISVTRMGGQPSIPTLLEVQEAIRGKRK